VSTGMQTATYPIRLFALPFTKFLIDFLSYENRNGC
jgi:hypothetical protein